jgi:hypothetical protein
MDAQHRYLRKFCRTLGWLLPIAIAGLLPVACNASQGKSSMASVERETPQARSTTGAHGNIVYSREIDGAPPVKIYVHFLSEGKTNPLCTLEIVENGVSVAVNSELLECGSLSSREMVDVEVSGSLGNLIVFQQKAKGTNSFSLQRMAASGHWVITKAEFVYPRDNLETGEVEVVRDSADLANSPILVNQYSPSAIKERLVQSLVQ